MKKLIVWVLMVLFPALVYGENQVDQIAQYDEWYVYKITDEFTDESYLSIFTMVDGIFFRMTNDSIKLGGFDRFMLVGEVSVIYRVDDNKASENIPWNRVSLGTGCFWYGADEFYWNMVEQCMAGNEIKFRMTDYGTRFGTVKFPLRGFTKAFQHINPEYFEKEPTQD
ncbi:MAG: hypothetical protein ABIK96_00780 [bacterium]